MQTRNFLISVASVVLSASLFFCVPTSASATESTGTNLFQNIVSSVFPNAELNANSGSKIDNNVSLLNESSLSEKFDLRDPNGDGDRSDSLVTSVKLQEPWGTCWGFASISAAETSILSRAISEGKSIDNLDLSELQVVNSVCRNGGAPEKYVGSDQAGEGYRNETVDPNRHLNDGGWPFFVSNAFACGIGPVKEFDAPYKCREETIKYFVQKKGSLQHSIEVLSSEQVSQLKLEGATVEKAYYAGNYHDASGNNIYTDWTTSDDLWNKSVFEFENSNFLPETLILKENLSGEKEYAGIDMNSVNAIKAELQQGKRAVTCNYVYKEKYYNYDPWTYYNDTYDSYTNHTVTIVGWDDTISADSFGGNDASGAKPEGDGAWLIKNSWGAKVDQYGNEQTFPNGQPAKDFGIEENGQCTGYFWLSYYDRTLTKFESFDFNLQTTELSDEFIVDQYDYLTPENYPTISTDEKSSTANIFAAESDMSIRTLGFTTFVPNTTVTCEVYLLDDEATTPTESNYSKLVAYYDETYDYAGYHRIVLNKDRWVALRQGQRYSVVVSQKCNTDGKWYQGVAIQQGKPTDGMVAYYKYSTAVRESINEQANSQGVELIEKYMKNGMSRDDAFTRAQSEMTKKYGLFVEYYSEIARLINNQKSESEAKAEAFAKYANIDLQKCSELEKDCESDVAEYSKVYWVAKVNKGESFISTSTVEMWDNKEAGLSLEAGSSNLSADNEWTDWKTVSDPINKEGTGLVCDNLSIKSYSEIKSWATVAELANLDSAISRAKQALENDAVSIDGSDVDTTQMWMTQAQKDELASAVMTAEELLALAGSDYQSTLANTTPTSENVNATTKTLDYKESAGLLIANFGSGDEGNDSNNTLQATGDTTQVMMFAILLATIASLFFTYASTRQKSKVTKARHRPKSH